MTVTNNYQRLYQLYDIAQTEVVLRGGTNDGKRMLFPEEYRTLCVFKRVT